jgi:myo-inositol-1(or 4)-monophosphatase
VEEIFRALKRASKEIFELIHLPMDESYYEYKGVGAGGDRSSKIDLVAEEIFCEHLAKYGRIVSEESGESGRGEYEIVLDPIDGSDNLLSRFPYFGSSIAFLKKGEVKLSFIVNFANGDFFVKWDGFYKKGSLLHEKLKDVRPNVHAKVGLFEKAYANPKIVEGLKSVGLKFRSPGAVALSLAYARYVNFVLFVGELRPYDVAAGLHQCQGLHLYTEPSLIIVAKNKEIFDKIKAITTKG